MCTEVTVEVTAVMTIKVKYFRRGELDLKNESPFGEMNAHLENESTFP